MTKVAGSVGIRRWILAAVIVGIAGGAPQQASADQGGVSFWIPGLFGSLAAVPGQPGFNFASVYYHTSVGASGAVAAQKQIEIGRLPRNANLNVDLNVELNARANVVFLVPGYIFETPIFGGQLGVSMAVIPGQQSATLDGALTASLGPLSVTRQGQISDSVSGFADLFPQATLKWNQGVHNWMLYGMTNIPVGTYDSKRLANLGLGHSAVDGGVGYTYFDPAKGHELSVVAGTTYNFTNNDTDYRNGQDYPCRCGRGAVSVEDLLCRCGRLLLRSVHRGFRFGTVPRRGEVARHRHRTADGLHHSDGRSAGLSQLQSLF